MESTIIYLATATLALLIFLPYFIKFRKKQRVNHERRKEAESLNVIRPQSQYPLIDQSRCIGCGSCVLACPEGDVLGVVYGKAMIINGLRCVGHGHCEPACPVSAIRVGLGDISTREDIPVLDAHHQSSVTGMYVVGELGGLSLIRNAIAQGQAAVRHIAATLNGEYESGVYDVVIVGAGPAGLTAALTALDEKLNYLVLDQQSPGGTILQYPRRKLVMTQPVTIPRYGKLTRSEYRKEELLEIWEAVIARNNLHIRTGQRVQHVEWGAGGFSIQVPGDNIRSRRVVLALGRRGTPRKLGVSGEDLPKVAYQLIDAQAYQNQHILVVGGGDSAVEAAIGLARQKGNTVSISYRKNRFFRIKKKNEDRIHRLIKERKITPIFDSALVSIRGKSVQLSIHEQPREIPNDYVFIFAGGIPPFKMLQEMGIRFGGEARPLVKSPQFT